MIEPVSLEAWQDYDARHPAPTFFARPAWAMALAFTFAHLTPHPLRVRSVRGGWLLVPLMQVAGGRLRWKELVGMPMGTYTCALREDGSLAPANELREALEAIARVCDSLSVTPWPLGPSAPIDGWLARAHETSVVSLAGGLDEALQNVDGRSRRMAGQAGRRGVSCALAPSPGLGISTFYGMLAESSDRWGLARPPFPKELLQAVVSYGGRDCEIWFAECDNHPIAGGVVLYGSQELFFWSAAMRHEYGRLRPSNALNLALFEAASARGVPWYNLGASEGLPGVERFKRGLGAQTVPYAEQQNQRTAYRMYTRVRASVRRLPYATRRG